MERKVVILVVFIGEQKNLGLDIPLKLTQSSNFLTGKSLCILLGSNILTTMKKRKSKL